MCIDNKFTQSHQSSVHTSRLSHPRTLTLRSRSDFFFFWEDLVLAVCPPACIRSTLLSKAWIRASRNQILLNGTRLDQVVLRKKQMYSMDTDDALHDQDEEYTDRQSMLDFSSSHRHKLIHIDKTALSSYSANCANTDVDGGDVQWTETEVLVTSNISFFSATITTSTSEARLTCHVGDTRNNTQDIKKLRDPLDADFSERIIIWVTQVLPNPASSFWKCPF